MKITKPTLIVDEEKAVRNIRRIMAKLPKGQAVHTGDIRFRPHFKTHQAARVGVWFRELGVTAITVSSVDMARYFAENGWRDITIGILVNPLEIDDINSLAEKTDLNLLVDTAGMAVFLERNLKAGVKVWIKIDTGYHRTGIECDERDEILGVANAIKKSSKLQFKGLLTHSGHSYETKSRDEIKKVYDETVAGLNDARNYLQERGITGVEISIGDTPTCSVVDEFYGVDEVRCGNFIYYDLIQLYLGACKEEDIAAAAACPVIARYPRRNEVVVYGGAVHLSKESITDENGRKIYGLAALPNENSNGWGPSLKETYVSSLSQEHGIIKTTPGFVREVNVGDILMILPVHSCLTANLLKRI
ncbi:MAG: alanine racemase [bacterium]|nr:alanine racemase [bacterium]